MMRWHRPARLAIGGFTVAFAVGMFLSVRDRPDAAGPAPIERADPDAVLETTGTVVTQARGDKRDYTVEAGRQLTYADGTSRLEDVAVTILARAGRDFVVTGRQGHVGSDELRVTLSGAVKMTASDGLVTTAQQATYDDETGIVRASGRVDFARGRLSGSGMGATYDRDRNVLRLLDQAHVRVGEGEGGRADIHSGDATLAQAERYMRFRRDVRIDQEGQQTRARRAIAYFNETDDRIRMVELRGGASVTTAGGGAGALRAMRARDMNLTYASDGHLLEQVTLAGDSSIELGGHPNQPPRRIAGRWIDLTLGPDGVTITSLTARDDVRLEFPPDAAAPAREILAPSMQGYGSAGAGLTSALFVGGVEYRESPSGRADDPRVTRAQTLETTLEAGLSAIGDALFAGEVRIVDGAMQAAADRARYDVDAGLIELRPASSDARKPRVVDELTSIDAQAVDLEVASGGLTASGEVRSVLTPRDPSASDAQVPGLLVSDLPAYVAGDQVVYDPESRQATYTGGARLWQEDTAVQGHQLVIDDGTGNLSATGSTRSAFLLEQVNLETQELEVVPTIATSEQMDYDHALRRTTYTTGARVNGPQGDLTATRIELYLAQEGSTLDRVEAYETVRLLQEDRTATGQRMTYYADDGRYVMHGAPVQILEALPGECRETRGQTLTFFQTTDTITVDGNEEVRTQSMTVGQCPAPQF